MNVLKNPSRNSLGLIITIATALVFGIYPSAARAIYQDGGNIVFVILITTFSRTLALLFASLFTKEKLFSKGSDCKLSFVGGFFQACSIIGILAGTYFMPGSVVLTILFTFTLLLLVFMAIKKEIELNAINITFTVTALIGLTFVLNLYSSESFYHPAGIGLAFLAAIATAIRLYIYSKQGQKRSPIIIGAENFTITFALLLLLLFWESPELPQSSYGLLMTALACLTMAVANFGMFYGLAMLNAYRFSLIAKIEPIFTALFGVLLLNEILTISQYFGIAIVIGSLVLIQLFDKQNN